MTPVVRRPRWQLRQGAWQDALTDVRPDAIITDPPYSERTHQRHNDRAAAGRSRDGSDRQTLSYTHWGAPEIDAFVDFWATRNVGWFVVLSDAPLCALYAAAFERHGLTTFQPLPCIISGMTCRLSGDGPSSEAVYANVARPPTLNRWGTLPGYYMSSGQRMIMGGKPESLMRQLVNDYSQVGDLVCDPCAGAATTLVCSLRLARNAIGSEIDPDTYKIAHDRLSQGVEPELLAIAPKMCAKCRGVFQHDAFSANESLDLSLSSWCLRCRAERAGAPVLPSLERFRINETDRQLTFNMGG